MLSYQTLGFIASSVNPTLGVVALAMAFSSAHRQGVTRPAAHVVTLLSGVAFAYLGWALKVSGIWPLFTQHYSTHSAVCVAIVSYLTFASRHWLRALWPAIGVAYVALMLHQRYHTLVHVLVTVAVVGPPVWLLHNRAFRNSP